MRVRKRKSGLSIHLVAGTHVVLMGLDVYQAAKRPGLLGFAIHRTDHTEDEAYWLEGTKTFEATDPGVGPGGKVSTRKHPLQTFLWSDYTAKPGHRYTYRVLALRGTPEALVEAESVSATVSTESELGHTHSVWFNRGVAASQEYARRFQNRKPSEVGEPALRWLSRGLFEALTGFIARADGPRYALRAALYETKYEPVLRALRMMRGQGADVQIVYDARASGERDHNEAALADAGLDDVSIPRAGNKGIPHNKFIVLLEDGLPISVWTGSTNITLGGIFGHANCGHMVEDADIAARYLAYWEQLALDPLSPELKPWCGGHSDLDPDDVPVGTLPIFSPRPRVAVLKCYAQLLAGAKTGACMTAAFGLDPLFVPAFSDNEQTLRYLLLESRGRNDSIARIEGLPSNRIAIGSKIVANNLDRWLAERVSGFNSQFSQYVHLKFLLVDPLTDDPIVVTGSANFSDESTLRNDENMLVIRGDTRVADIYLGEFMRLYTHHRFRQWLAEKEAAGEAEQAEPKHLVPSDAWARIYFDDDHPQGRQREFFK